MNTLEDRFQSFIRKNILWMAFAAVFVFGAFMRYTLVSYIVPDMMADYLPWMRALQAGGIHNLLETFTPFPYSAMHVYIWALVAGLFPHADALLLLKSVAIAFDAAQAVVACLLVWELLPKERKMTGLFVGFTLLWLNPILLLNAAAWGQTDTIYLAFSLLTLLFLFRKKPAAAMLCFGVALAFKLQAVFLLPALMMLYFCYEKKFSALWFLLVPAVWFAARLPMQWMEQGASSAAAFLTSQTSAYADATMNYPNLHAMLNEAVKSPLLVMVKWERYSIFLTVTALGGMAVWLIIKQIKLDSQNALLLGAWCALACVFFLPHMHERYGIVGEILLLIWAVLLWKPRGFGYVLLSMLPIGSAYCKYVLDREIFSLQLGGAMNMLLLFALTWEVIRQGKEQRHGA